MREKKKRNPTAIVRRMAEVLKAHPEGLTFPEIRAHLNLQPDEQGQLDRRKRDLYDFYIIRQVREGSRVVYVYDGEREEPRVRAVTNTDRYAALHRAHGRCARCGRDVEKHEIALVVDHKIPKAWGGGDELTNLEALCEDCNAGKKDYFASFDESVMRKVMLYESPHMRIGELLKLHLNQPVPSWLIEFIAFDQEDWPKRTRDLRYLGWKIKVVKKKNPQSGRVESSYVLKSFTNWPENPSKWIRDFEAGRAKRNRARK